jgi:hypothetical protein
MTQAVFGAAKQRPADTATILGVYHDKPERDPMTGLAHAFDRVGAAPRERDCVLLRIKPTLNGHREIGEQLGIERETVSNAIRRFIERCGNELGETEDEIARMKETIRSILDRKHKQVEQVEHENKNDVMMGKPYIPPEDELIQRVGESRRQFRKRQREYVAKNTVTEARAISVESNKRKADLKASSKAPYWCGWLGVREVSVGERDPAKITDVNDREPTSLPFNQPHRIEPEHELTWRRQMPLTLLYDGRERKQRIGDKWKYNIQRRVWIPAKDTDPPGGMRRLPRPAHQWVQAESKRTPCGKWQGGERVGRYDLFLLDQEGPPWHVEDWNNRNAPLPRDWTTLNYRKVRYK